MPFLLAHFSPGGKIENCSAPFLPVCWIVRVEFKVHRLRDSFSVTWGMAGTLAIMFCNTLERDGNE
jgi:hypothetical protein